MHHLTKTKLDAMRSLKKKVLHIADLCSYGCGRGGLQAASSFAFSDSAGLRAGGWAGEAGNQAGRWRARWRPLVSSSELSGQETSGFGSILWGWRLSHSAVDEGVEETVKLLPQKRKNVCVQEPVLRVVSLKKIAKMRTSRSLTTSDNLIAL